MAKLTSELTTDKLSSDPQFNAVSLFNYCRAHVHGFPSSATPSHFSVRQFGHGQSNPTFLLEVDANGILNRYVLRKRPPGKLLPSAHAVEREFKVLQALGTHTKVPVPKVFCLCIDTSVIGTSFYVMEYLEGRIFLDPTLPDLEPHRKNAINRESARALASLHQIDVDTIGLGNYGLRENYCKRQVERWGKQYMASTAGGKPERNPKMLELISWLHNNLPLEDSSGSASGLVHGDFRIDNLIFHPNEDRVIGILDWELSTLGNQMCDVAYNCLHYVVDYSIDKIGQDKGLEETGIPEGIPSMAEYLAEYCSAAGKPWPAAHWKFYIAFSLFRAAAIYAGIYSRWIMGNASGGERAIHTGAKANALIDYAWSFIAKPSVLPERPPSGPFSSDHVQNYGNQREIPNTLEEGGKYSLSGRVIELRSKLIRFMEDHIYPMEDEFYKLALSPSRWTVHPAEEKLKELAKREGLWNLWIPLDSAMRAKKIFASGKSQKSPGGQLLGPGLSNLEYGHLCEIMGRSVWAPQIFNCGAPDTGNMEVLLRYGTEDQLKEWLIPLLEGQIRSGFAMTEPQVASSDATNIECSIKRDGDSYVINGTKWWTSGAMDPRCKLLIVMGKTDFDAPKHKQQSMILVDAKTPGVHIKRPLMVFGFDDAPHGHAEVSFQNVRVPDKNILLGEGRGFEIAQGRLGPGRLHHCMRLIGAAERGMQMMAERALQRRVFGKLIAQQGSFLSDIAKCRVELEKTRLLVLEAADQLDRLGNKKARGTIAMAKVAAPTMALQVLDMAMQVHGALGLSNDSVLAHLWATARTLRIADGPDEVHLGTIAKLELRKSKM
ncbi:probable acyl-CoA dehydrogenase IBR3 [Chenopodium quinoa]|uniref:probable acyl-CoA dehydrogenase IBR3 n=1 Tax=Chenopodium quinoa TaxID=63459 RepID=UPI000B79A117|nr:probable acyl-CoA dehydrogenase IBR3 [Chenopodium quinoa]